MRLNNKGIFPPSAIQSTTILLGKYRSIKSRNYTTAEFFPVHWSGSDSLVCFQPSRCHLCFFNLYHLLLNFDVCVCGSGPEPSLGSGLPETRDVSHMFPFHWRA